MISRNLIQQQMFFDGSPVRTQVGFHVRTPLGSPVRTPLGSPVRTPLGSPVRTPLGCLSGSPTGCLSGSPTGCLSESPTGSPKHKKIALTQCLGTPENKCSSSTFIPFTESCLFAETDDFLSIPIGKMDDHKLKTPFIPQRYKISLSSPISPNVSPRRPLTGFCQDLVKTNFFSPNEETPSQDEIVQNLTPFAHGSFFTVYSGFLGDTRVVQKTVTVASMCGPNIDPTVFTKPMDKSALLKYLTGLQMSTGNPNFAQPISVVFTQTSESSGELVVVQPMCNKIVSTRFGARQFMECIMKIFDSGFPIQDVKYENFGKNNRKVVCLDPDLGTDKQGRIRKVVKSAEYNFSGIDAEFKKLILVLMKFMCENVASKEDFQTLYAKKSVLSNLNLLDSDKSISETDINDFIMIINRLCPQAPQEHIDLLVKVLTVPFSK